MSKAALKALFGGIPEVCFCPLFSFFFFSFVCVLLGGMPEVFFFDFLIFARSHTHTCTNVRIYTHTHTHTHTHTQASHEKAIECFERANACKPNLTTTVELAKVYQTVGKKKVPFFVSP